MEVTRLDHLVLTVADIDVSAEFYCKALGMQRVEFGGGRTALTFGQQKINLHKAGAEFSPHARQPMPGSGDLCFVTEMDLAEVEAHLDRHGVSIKEGPVARSGALGPIESLYFDDPDGNLIEVSRYLG